MINSIHTHINKRMGLTRQRLFSFGLMMLILCFAGMQQAFAQSNLTRVEYYIDKDPGFGLATPLTFSATNDLQNATIVVNPTGLSEGVHRLYVRARNSNGWSLTNSWLFYKPFNNGATPAPAPLATIKKLEYFIDNDPGNGLGFPVAIQQLTNLSDQVISVNTSGLSSGAHSLQVRAQDSTGAWSLVNTLDFTVNPANTAAAIIANSVSKTTLCARDSVTIGYQATGTYNAGNTFTAFISNASGSFTNEQIIGSVTSTKSGLIECKLPSHLPDGSGYKIRIKSSNTVLTGASSSYSLTIRDRPNAQTISGLASVNGTEIWPYNVPTATNSTWNWLVTNGVKTTGGTTNSGNIQWASGDAQVVKPAQIKVIETNQYGCIGDTSIQVVSIYKLRIAGTPSTLIPCPYNSVTVTLNTDGVFYATPSANQFVAELSNANGNFSSPTASVSITASGITGTAQTPGNIIIPIPGSLPNGNNYKIRVRSTNPVFIGDTSAAISIQKPNLGQDIARSKCIGFGYNLRTDYTDQSLTYGYFNNTFLSVSRPDSVDAGTYNVIGTNTNGCKDTAVVTVTNFPKPNLGADTTVYHICTGETTNLIPLYTTTGLTAIWNTTNTAAAIPGVYRLIVTNTSGCTDTAFANIKLEVATWTGATSSNWHTAGNWSTNSVPFQKTHVIIPAGATNPCFISAADGEVASIQVKLNANFKVASTRKLLVSQRCPVLP